MKTVIKSSKVHESQEFKCLCGCKFISDEYIIDRIDNNKMEISDKCPECKEKCEANIYR